MPNYMNGPIGMSTEKIENFTNLNRASHTIHPDIEKIRYKTSTIVNFILSMYPIDTTVDWESANSYEEIKTAIDQEAKNVINKITQLAPTKSELSSYVEEYKKSTQICIEILNKSKNWVKKDFLYLQALHYKMNVLEESLKYFNGPLEGYQYFNPKTGKFCFNSEEEGESNLYKNMLEVREKRGKAILDLGKEEA